MYDRSKRGLDEARTKRKTVYGERENVADLGTQPQSITRRNFLASASAAGAFALTAYTPQCAHSRPTRTSLTDASGARSLRSTAANAGLLVGFALSVSSLRNSSEYRRVAQEQCSIAVAENAMKWEPMRPAPDRYFFDDADFILSFVEANRIKMRGHNLCWHEQLPTWFNATATAANARSLLTDHIRNVAGRYAGRMHSWDVVNEAVWIQDGRTDGLRNTPWLRLIGNDYIELAFRTARQADPTALLTYNETWIEGESVEEQQRRAAVLLLLRRLRQRNVPIDAVGIQSHLRARTSFGYGPSLRRFIQNCRELELEVFLTEMDVNDQDLPTDPEKRDVGVADTYASYLNAALAEPNVRAVLTWGIGDGQTWLNDKYPRKDGQPQRPLLFDKDFRPTAPFGAVTGAFSQRKHTILKNPAGNSRPLPKL